MKGFGNDTALVHDDDARRGPALVLRLRLRFRDDTLVRGAGPLGAALPLHGPQEQRYADVGMLAVSQPLRVAVAAT